MVRVEVRSAVALSVPSVTEILLLGESVDSSVLDTVVDDEALTDSLEAVTMGVTVTRAVMDADAVIEVMVNVIRSLGVGAVGLVDRVALSVASKVEVRENVSVRVGRSVSLFVACSVAVSAVSVASSVNEGEALTMADGVIVPVSVTSGVGDREGVDDGGDSDAVMETKRAETLCDGVGEPPEAVGVDVSGEPLRVNRERVGSERVTVPKVAVSVAVFSPVGDLDAVNRDRVMVAVPVSVASGVSDALTLGLPPLRLGVARVALTEIESRLLDAVSSRVDERVIEMESLMPRRASEGVCVIETVAVSTEPVKS
jgi:hypothetical protein